MNYFAQIDTPVSADSPCGADLDTDPAVQTFLTMAEGILPADLFSYLDFDRRNFDDKGNIEKVTEFLRSYRDIRLLVLAIKTFALSDNLNGFFDGLTAIAMLLDKHWSEVFPRAQDGDYSLRSAYVQSLVDTPTVLLPLQQIPLVKDRRAGAISFRAYMLAKKLTKPRKDETILDEQSVRDIFLRAEPIALLTGLRDQFASASGNVQKIRELFVTHAGYEAAPQFDQLSAYLKGVQDFLNDVIAEREPPEATEPASEDAEGAENASAGTDGNGAPAAAAPAGELLSIKEASNALQAIVTYYSANEPSSPAMLLVKQAHQLVGKSFVEAMQVLAPGLVEDTKIDIAGQTSFSLNFGQLQLLASDGSEPGSEGDETRTFEVKTRGEASELMKSVERCYRKLEPSSPIPLLLDRARKFVAKDFATLLSELSKKQESKD